MSHSETACDSSGSPHLLPLFLKLAGRRVLMVGAGPVAASKLDSLLDTGAHVTVVAPQVHPSMRRPGVLIEQRDFVPSDVDTAWFVMAAAPPDINLQVLEAAQAQRIFVNAVDHVAAATCYAGSVMRRGDLTLSFSTHGSAPAVAGLLREAFEALVPQDVSAWIDKARQLRPVWRANGTPMQERRPALLRALNQLYAHTPTTAEPCA